MNNKAQGLSLTTIIIAAVGLIVLVLLVAIFTGRIAIFSGGVSEAANTELVRLKLDYGECHPSLSAEKSFTSAFSKAKTGQEESQAMSVFEQKISDCAGKSADGCSNGCKLG